MPDSFDAVVIGGGPGGYNAAIRLAKLGLKAACVDARGRFGGTCLNIGCIPSKALLHASELFEKVNKDLGRLGIKAEAELDLKAMMAHKDKVVDELTKGVEFLFRKNKIEPFVGTARIAAPGQVEVTGKDGKRSLTCANIIIATGSASSSLPGVTIDETQIVSSTGALSLPRVPKRLVVVGAGYIGLELGSVWRRLGSEVTVVEFLDRIAPGLDGEIARTFQRLLQRQGLRFQLGSKVSGITKAGRALKLSIEPAQGGAGQTIEADVALICVGRSPFTDGLGLESVGVALDARKRIVTDRKYRTNVEGIWAIGDVREGPMLAHKAEDEAVACAENIAGKAGHVNYSAIPAVVYTQPEVASVGSTEEDLKA
ncbi:MAG: dihydrolipoyl dehydrogenase, partial [Alphaproteobacteria bacterium]|nr:dihydrolipoyl dehydrogenase [Alphaproteobacteria bacterium]